MNFSDLSEVKKAVSIVVQVSKGGRKHYPVAFKQALCKAIRDGVFTTTQVADDTRITSTSIYAWLEQYDANLLTMEGAYSVSKKSLKINDRILGKLRQQKAEIEERIQLIQKCEALGLRVS